MPGGPWPWWSLQSLPRLWGSGHALPGPRLLRIASLRAPGEEGQSWEFSCPGSLATQGLWKGAPCLQRARLPPLTLGSYHRNKRGGWGWGTAGCPYCQPVGHPCSQQLPEGCGPSLGVGVAAGNTAPGSHLIWSRGPLSGEAGASSGLRGVVSVLRVPLCSVSGGACPESPEVRSS